MNNKRSHQTNTLVEDVHQAVKRKVIPFMDEIAVQINSKRESTYDEIVSILHENADLLQLFVQSKKEDISKIMKNETRQTEILTSITHSIDAELLPKIKTLDRKTEIAKYSSQLENELRAEIDGLLART